MFWIPLNFLQVCGVICFILRIWILKFGCRHIYTCYYKWIISKPLKQVIQFNSSLMIPQWIIDHSGMELGIFWNWGMSKCFLSLKKVQWWFFKHETLKYFCIIILYLYWVHHHPGAVLLGRRWNRHSTINSDVHLISVSEHFIKLNPTLHRGGGFHPPLVFGL